MKVQNMTSEQIQAEIEQIQSKLEYSDTGCPEIPQCNQGRWYDLRRELEVRKAA